MSKKFKITRDYWEEGEFLYDKEEIEIKEGLTVLIGCNGSGKTTLLNIIKSKLKEENTPCIAYDNLVDGGFNARSKAGFFEDYSFLATSICSSEGENIIMNTNNLARKIGYTLRKNPDLKEFWVLIDGIDSGLSIDNILILKKDMFNFILKDLKKRGITGYFVCSANEYELASGEQCFAVNEGEYISIKSYEEYKRYILKSNTSKAVRRKNK